MKSVIEVRDHPCFCANCLVKDYNGCAHKQTVGIWIPKSMTFKEIPKIYENLPSNLTAVTKFLHGAIRQSDSTVIVGLMLLEKETGVRHLKLATLCIPPRINIKGAQLIDHTIDKTNFAVTIGKGSPMIRARLLVKQPNTEHEYCLPTNSKMHDFAISDVVDPTALLTDSLSTRLTYLKYTMSELPYMNRNNKPCIQIIYTFEESALKLLSSAFISV